MKPKFVHAENFCSAGDLQLQLDQEGLILVLGENRDAPKADSNGSGKTILLDSCCWAIWGKTTRGLSADDVVHSSVGKNCKVSFTFEEFGKEYRIERYRKHSESAKPNDLLLFIDGQEATSASTTATQQLIDDVIGFDFQTFCAMMPGSGIQAATMTDQQVKALLEQLLQTSALSEAYTKAHAKAKELEAVVTKSDFTVQSCTAQLTDLNDNLSKYKVLLEQSDRMHADKVAALHSKVVVVTASLAAIPDSSDSLSAYQEQMAKLKTDLAVAQSLESVCLVGLKADEDACKLRTTTAFKQLCQVEATLKAAQKDRDSKKKLLEAAQCPTCEQSLASSSLVGDLSSLTKHVEELREQSIQSQKTYEECTDACAKQAASAHTGLTLTASVTSGIKAQVSSLIELIDSTKSKLSEKQSLQNTLQALIQEKATVEADIQYKASIEDLITSASNKAFGVAQEQSRAMAISTDTKDELAYYKFWLDGFSPTGLRSYMLEHVIPILNERAAHYSAVLTGGEMDVVFSTKTELKSKEVREYFSINVSQAHGANTYAGCSQGEKARADLVIAMALGDLASLRSNRSLSFRFFDESFEKVDESGAEAVMRLLNEQRSKFDSIFVVTHRDSMKQFFQKTITVVKENGFSHLETT